MGMDMGDVLDMDMVILDIMASVRLRLSLRLLLIPTFCMEDMAMLDTILDMPDMLDTHTLDMDMVILDTMASVMLMPSPRLMLIPTFCMEDMAMDTILDMPDIEDMLDTHMVDMPTMDKLIVPRHENGQI